MKRPHIHIVIVAVLAALLSSCLNTLELVAPAHHIPQTEDVTHTDALLAAQQYHTQYKELLTRVVNSNLGDDPRWPWQEDLGDTSSPDPDTGVNNTSAPYPIGNHTIDWEHALVGENQYRREIIADIYKDTEFLMYFPDTLPDVGLRLYSHFFSVEDFQLDTLNQYIATYIPDRDYLSKYENVRETRGYIGFRQSKFCGVMLYTTLTGHHVAAYRFRNGHMIGASFLYDHTVNPTTRYNNFFTIMDGVDIGVYRATDISYDTTQWVVWRVNLWGKVIVYMYKKKSYGYVNPSWLYDNTVLPGIDVRELIVEPIIDPLIGGGGGGGGSSDNDDDEAGGDTSAGGIDGKTPEEVSEDIFNNYGNLADSVKTKLNTMIAEIAEDCMGKELLSQLMEKSVAVGLSFSNEGNSKFYHDSNGVVMVNNHSEGLMHELFHAYQYNVSCQGNVATYAGLIKNFEAEAYVATYFYMNRYAPYNSAISDRLETFINNNLIGYHASLAAECINSSGESLEDKSFKDFIDNFEIAGQIAVNDKDIMFFIGEDNTEYYTSIMGLLSSKCD
ncbi:MAG: hypothetical protein IJD12_05150 [Tidjanibacter sp.]|nr:hypothetical protein [Tidjanibacter sp.]